MAIQDSDIQDYLRANPGLSDRQIADAMLQYNVSPSQMARATGVPIGEVHQRIDKASPDYWLKTPDMQEYLAQEATKAYQDQGYDVSQMSDIRPYMSVDLGRQGALQYTDPGRRGEAQRMVQALKDAEMQRVQRHFEDFGQYYVPPGYQLRSQEETDGRKVLDIDADYRRRQGPLGGKEFRQFTPAMASSVEQMIRGYRSQGLTPQQILKFLAPEATARYGFMPAEVVNYLRTTYPDLYGDLTTDQYVAQGGGAEFSRPLLQAGYQAQGILSAPSPFVSDASVVPAYSSNPAVDTTRFFKSGGSVSRGELNKLPRC
jgi:hypothetical protein